ncbi:hypothetical protein ES708_35000 [subsurface metagenome]
MIANSVGYTEITRKTPEGSYLRKYFPTTTKGNPFDWGRTWGVWLVYSASCCLFEFLLFRDKKKKDKELTGDLKRHGKKFY